MSTMSTPRTQLSSGLTRRAALTRLGAGGLGMALAVRGFSAAAQEATPPVVADLPPVLQEYIAAWEALDIDRVIATLTEDAVLEDVPAGVTAEGQEAIRNHYEEFFVAFPDATLQYTTAFATDEWAAGEWIFSGSYTGAIPDFPPGEGQQVAVRCADIIELANGQIRYVREYYDFYGFLVQLGVLPPPDEPATPPA